MKALKKSAPPAASDVAILTGGWDPPYAFGLAMALLRRGMRLDIIGGDEIERLELHRNPMVTSYNLRGDQNPDAGAWGKMRRILFYYARLVGYAWRAQPRIFHILWHNRFEFFDRTVLMLYYRALGKKIVLTAHNVNAGRRDSHESMWNRLGLRIQYHLADHIFVHTELMKRELMNEFAVQDAMVTVIPFGINNAVPRSHLSSREAKDRLGIRREAKTILFFGNIAPYKGLEYLVNAFGQIDSEAGSYQLIIAGRPKRGCEDYARGIQESANCRGNRDHVMFRVGYVPDEETEVYFMAADVAVLPYTDVSQSGVLILAYSFGLPVIVTDVGSLKEDVVEGTTGFLCKPRDAADINRAIKAYFESSLWHELEGRRAEIQKFAERRFSWEAVSGLTCRVYGEMSRAWSLERLGDEGMRVAAADRQGSGSRR